MEIIILVILNEINGNGSYYDNDDNLIYEGEWLNGNYNGWGNYYNNKLQYSGNWANNKKMEKEHYLMKEKKNQKEHL